MKLFYETAKSVASIDARKLYNDGKRFFILDLDNTVARWKTFAIKDDVICWINNAKEMGFVLCILSNNHNRKRTDDIAELLGVKAFASKNKKPSVKAYIETLEFLDATPEQTVMIGDQLFTDVKGALKAGIGGILVDPIYKKEAFITKILRICERMAGRKIIWQDK